MGLLRGCRVRGRGRLFPLGPPASAGSLWAAAAQGYVGWDSVSSAGFATTVSPRRTWIVRLAGFHGGIDDGGSGELALSVASSHPLLDFPEDVGHVEVPLPAPVTSAGGLRRAAASAMEELGPDARHGSSCPDYRKLNN